MVRHRLCSHIGLLASTQLPALGDVLALVDREETPGGHWYWLGDFSRDREALMPIRLLNNRTAHLAVPRLLHQLMGNYPAGAGVLNECGVVSCVNPAHWSIETRRERGQKRRVKVFTDFHGHGWTPTRTEVCQICGCPPNSPCDPVYHDADFRHRMSLESTLCPICGALPHRYCNEEFHRAAFEHALAAHALERKESDGSSQ